MIKQAQGFIVGFLVVLGFAVWASPGRFTFGTPTTGTLVNYAEGFIADGTQNVDFTGITPGDWVEVDGCTSGELLGITHSACDYTLSAGSAGMYQIAYTMSFAAADAGGNSDTFKGAISVDDAIHESCRMERKLGLSGDVGAAAGGCLVLLADGEVVKIEMASDDDDDATVTQLTFVMHKI